MSSSKSEFDKILAQHVHAASLISDEEEAQAVWKGILARKGLPLDTPYEHVVSFNKTYDESYCDRLFATIREKKKNPEAAWPFAPFPSSGKTLAIEPSQMSSSKAEFDKKLAQHVHAASLISEEEEAEAVWKDILARKGLPLDTPYEHVVSFNKAYDESYCDRLFATIREKKKNPQAAWPFAPAPAPPSRKTSSSSSASGFRLAFNERNSGKKKKKSINRLIYQDEDSENKRKAYLIKKRDESIEWFKQRETKFGPAANNFLHH